MSSVGAVFKKGRQERAASQIQAQKLESKSSPRSHHTWWDPQKYTGYPPCTTLLGTSSTHQPWMGGKAEGLCMKGPRKGSCVECLVPTINGSNRWRWLDDKHTSPVDKFIDKLLLKGTRCEVTQIITGCVIWRVCLSQAPCSFYFLAVVEWTPLPHRVLRHSGLLWHSGLLPP